MGVCACVGGFLYQHFKEVVGPLLPSVMQKWRAGYRGTMIKNSTEKSKEKTLGHPSQVPSGMPGNRAGLGPVLGCNRLAGLEP